MGCCGSKEETSSEPPPRISSPIWGCQGISPRVPEEIELVEQLQTPEYYTQSRYGQRSRPLSSSTRPGSSRRHTGDVELRTRRSAATIRDRQTVRPSSSRHMSRPSTSHRHAEEIELQRRRSSATIRTRRSSRFPASPTQTEASAARRVISRERLEAPLPPMPAQYQMHSSQRAALFPRSVIQRTNAPVPRNSLVDSPVVSPEAADVEDEEDEEDEHPAPPAPLFLFPR